MLHFHYLLEFVLFMTYKVVFSTPLVFTLVYVWQDILYAHHAQTSSYYLLLVPQQYVFWLLS